MAVDLIPVSRLDPSPSRGDVVFVHGLEGDARTTWHPKGHPESSWPAWLGQDLPDLAIWSLSYDAPVSAWRSASSPLIDLAGSTLSVLEAHGIGTRPLVFVAHSLGGLLVKQLLRQATGYGNPDWQRLHDRVRGVVFLSTPHAGADAANWLRHLAGILHTSVSVRELEAHNAQLRDLNLWFRSHVQRAGLPLQVYVERLPTRGIRVVDPTSADPGIAGITPILMDADHSSIAKPESPSSTLYLRVRRFIEERLSPTETSGESTAAQVRTFLMADIRGYTTFTLEHGDEAAARLASRFAELTREVVAARDGAVIELRGDEALAVFSSGRQAMRAAVELQDRFAREAQDDATLPLRVGIGLDVGEAVAVEGGYRGAAPSLAARLSGLAGPGEILASETATGVARRVEGIAYRERGLVELKGFADPVKVIEVSTAEQQETAAAVVATPPAEGDQVFDQHLPIGGFLGSLPSGTLVARDRELTQVLEAVGAVGRGEGRLVLLAGEPGAGKTRLAQEATVALHHRGFLIAAGRCHEPEQAVPYYPFLDVLPMVYAAAPSSVRQDAPRRWPYLGALLPEQIGVPEVVGGSGQDEQQRVFRAVTGFLQAVTASRPLAILLDDLHWADSASLKLLQHVARHTRSMPIGVLGTYRDVEVGRQHPLEGVLRDLQREGLMERVNVRRLDEEGTAALVATVMGEAGISSEFASLVYGRTEGNPYFVQQVLRVLMERGDVFRTDAGWERRAIEEIEVPESVRSVVGQRLSQLPEEAQDVLREASVLGQSFAFDDLLAIGNRDEREVEDAVEEAAAIGLIRDLGHDVYNFDHALTQQAIYAELSSRRRRRLHLAAGEALERLPERKRKDKVAALAWHFLEGDDQERALRYSLLAGDRAEAVFARGEAERHYRTALELAEETDDRPRLAEATFKLGMALYQAGDCDEALPLLEQAAVLYADLGDPVMEGRASQVTIRLHNRKGAPERSAEALSHVESLLGRIFQAEPTRDLVLFYDSFSLTCWAEGRLKNMLAMAERGVDVARALGDAALVTRMELRRVQALGVTGRVREAALAAEEIIPRAEAAGDLETLGTALEMAGEFSTLAGEFERSRAHREREREIYERRGDAGRSAFAFANLAQLERYRGNWQESRDHAERALMAARSLDHRPVVRFALMELGELGLLTGDWKAATLRFEEAATITGGTMQMHRSLQRGLAELDVLLGHPEAALIRLAPLIEGANFQDMDILLLLPTLARAALGTGDIDRVVTLAGEAVGRAEAQENALVLVDALCVQGMALGQAGRTEDAAEAFDQAVALARRMPYPYAEGRARYEWAMLDLEGSEVEPAARQRLREALRIFEGLGAKAYIEWTQHALGAMGGVPHKAG